MINKDVAVLAAIVVAGDVPTGREILGCVLMFTAVILAQVEWPKKRVKAS